MKLYRVGPARFSYDLSGKGAELNGGRWNSKGVPLLYTCETIPLCLGELLVHLPKDVPKDYRLTTICVQPEPSMIQTDVEQLPPEWMAVPYSESTQLMGDSFVRMHQSLILKVPSVVVVHSYNYLINPQHPAFSSVTVENVEPFPIDHRLIAARS